jgi:hypothetical protein
MPADLELDVDGVLLVHGRPHLADPEREKTLAERAPKFHSALITLGELIGAVDDERWRQEALRQIVALLNGMSEEMFAGCCPMCRAVLEASFAAAGGLASA